MPIATFKRTTAEDLKKSFRCQVDDRVEKGFIGPDNKRHMYEYNKSDYKWHSHMTNEEWMEKNNLKQLSACQKCSLWEKCRTKEHTILTMNGVTEKLSDDLAKEIDKQILEDLKEKYKV